MPSRRRVTAYLPGDLLDEAMDTGAYRAAMALRGKVKLKVDLAGSRERPRR